MRSGRSPGTSLDDVAEVGPGGRGRPDAPAARAARPNGRPPRAARFTGPRRALWVAALVAVIALPLAVALGVLRQPTWHPTDDLAQTELQVRDVGTGHPPLVGLAGRLGTLDRQGSHPGPLSFWSLWPLYQLFGAHAWALQAAAVSLHVIAIATALWIAFRRGGLGLVVAVAAVLAPLVRAYGTVILTQAWNPYLPVMWWIVFVLAVWSIVSDDPPMLLVAVFAGSFCMQTHLPYLGLAAGLLAGALAAAFGRAYARRREEPRRLRRLATWTIVAAAAGVILWLPPLIEELVHAPGNLSIVRHELLHPPQAPIGARRGLELLLVHLNPWKIVAEQPRATAGALLPGGALLLAWIGAVIVAWRARHRPLLRLHAVLAGSLLLAAVSLSRIHGFVWYYLALWAWGTTALLLLAVGWAAILVIGKRLDSVDRTRLAAAGSVALVAVVVVSTVSFTVDAARAENPAPRLSATLGELVPPTADALARWTPGGRKGRYLVTWFDPVSIGAQGFGLLNELERRGFDVGARKIFVAGVRSHRLVDPSEAAAEVHLAVGSEIQTWRARPGARQVAYVDPRSPAERVEFDRLRREAIRGLQEAGLAVLVPAVDSSLFTTILDSRVPERPRALMTRMRELGLPTAVFIAPPGR
jgi:hypothetical protein